MIDEIRPALVSSSVHLPEQPSGTILLGRHPSVLVYGEHGRTPAVLLKFAPSDDARALIAEQRALEQLASVVGSRLRVPRVLACIPTGQWIVVAQTVVPGASQYRRLRGRLLARRRVAITDLEQACEWLLRFQRLTADAEASFDLAAATDALRITIETAGDLTPDRSRALISIAARADESGVARLPTVWAHGDFWPGNILRDRDELAVIDWAHLSRDASPSIDLTFAILTWAHSMRWPDRPWSAPEQAFDRAFYEPGWFRDEAARLVARHLAAFGVGEGAFDLLRLHDLHDLATRGEMPVGPQGDWYAMMLKSLDRV